MARNRPSSSTASKFKMDSEPPSSMYNPPTISSNNNNTYSGFSSISSGAGTGNSYLRDSENRNPPQIGARTDLNYGSYGSKMKADPLQSEQDALRDATAVELEAKRRSSSTRANKIPTVNSSNIHADLEPYHAGNSSVTKPPNRHSRDIANTDQSASVPFKSKPSVPSTIKVGDVEIGDIDDDLENELAELDVAPRIPHTCIAMVIDSKPIDLQTAIVSTC